MFYKIKNINFGPILIMIGASMWALDALFRTQLTFTMSAGSIVFFEHLVGFLFLLPIFIKSIDSYKKLNSRDWVFILLLTIVSSTLGTYLFTLAISRGFVETILMQQLQPIFVIVCAYIFLKEKLNIKFFGLVVVSLIGVYMINFGTEFVSIDFQAQIITIILALSAAMAWGTGTLISKIVLNKLSFPQATAIRFLMAIPITFVFSIITKSQYSIDDFTFANIWRILIIALTTGGVGAILLYYKGLATTKARVATIAELMFPIIGILIAISAWNPYGYPQQLSLANVFGIVILLISILIISFDFNDKD
jgi:drug/metabolite transporter (DMT)-like permease